MTATLEIFRSIITSLAFLIGEAFSNLCQKFPGLRDLIGSFLEGYNNEVITDVQ